MEGPDQPPGWSMIRIEAFTPFSLKNSFIISVAFWEISNIFSPSSKSHWDHRIVDWIYLYYNNFSDSAGQKTKNEQTFFSQSFHKVF